MLKRLEVLRDGGAVTRFHSLRMIRTQTVAAHSHGVAVLVTTIHPTARSGLLKAALFHDLAEVITGDTPATAKWLNPLLRDELETMELKFNERYDLSMGLDLEEQHILKWCDMMELVLWCMEEFQMGNTFASRPLINGLRHLKEIGAPNPLADGLYGLVAEAWRDIQ